MPTDTLRPNGSFSLGWTNPGANHHLEVDDGSWPPTSDDDTTDINETGTSYDVTDEYDLDAVTNMGASDTTTDVEVDIRVWNNKASGDTNDFYVDLIVDGASVGESTAQQAASSTWTSLNYAAAAWQGQGWSQSQVNSMRVRVRCNTAKSGKPHDITSKVSAVAVTVVSAAPSTRRIFVVS